MRFRDASNNFCFMIGGSAESMKNSQKISIEFALVSDAAVPTPTRDRLRQVETDAAPVGARKVRTIITIDYATGSRVYFSISWRACSNRVKLRPGTVQVAAPPH